jgi:hypothetical protein
MKDESAGRRAAAYWFADGLPDIVFGLMLLLFAATGFLWQMYAPHARAYDLWLMVIPFGLFYWQGRAVLDFLKSRVTYPRTGYVQPPEEDERPVISPPALIILSLIPGPPVEENATSFNRRTAMPIFLILSLSLNPKPLRPLAPLVLLALAIALYAVNRDSERPYHWLWALILALTGLVFLWVEVPPLLQPLLSYLLVGGWLVAHGVSMLVQYLHANPHNGTPEGVRA